MQFEFDETKNQVNIRERGLSFSRVEEFDFRNAYNEVDKRFKDEVRIKALGYIENRLYMVVYTMREFTIRVISFRKANDREVKKYETQSLSH
jgi:uncharacterized protein